MDDLKKGNCAVAREFIVLDGDYNEIPYQITHDGKVLVFCTVRPESSISLSMIKGQPQDYELTCNGRIYPNRWDDLVWENDRCAWRFYGPGAHKHMKNNAYGFDTFTKNTPHPIQDQLYHNELTSYGVNEQIKKSGSPLNWDEVHRGYTYHRNHGAGMDAYTVGATLGAGAAALKAADGSLVYPLYYEKAEILDNGPLRFTVRMTMPKRALNGDSIQETRLITQDCGSHFARVEITYKGLNKPTPVCAGIVVHKSAPKAYTLNQKEGFITYADALDTPEAMNGEHYLGVFLPKTANGKTKSQLKYEPLPEKTPNAIGHALIQTTYTPGQPFVYYTGSAWSHYDVPTLAIWQETLRHEASILQNGLQLINH